MSLNRPEIYGLTTHAPNYDLIQFYGSFKHFSNGLESFHKKMNFKNQFQFLPALAIFVFTPFSCCQDQAQYCHIELDRIGRFDLGRKSNLIIVTFFSKIFNRTVLLSSGFAKTFLYDRQIDVNRNRVCHIVQSEKNNICISCVFNGFKYISMVLKFQRII